MELDGLPLEGAGSSGATAEDWQKSLARVVRGVVVLRTTACRAFDTETASSGYATGFVVDKARSIILTNRHVVKPGPVVAEAIFLNREEIPVYPLYRDPVHDFGFFRFDPKSVEFMNYEEIPLAPEAAAVGLEIRVVGNDSGEKLSILAGTIARLDRDAPPYKKDGYNDFNTFYMQAASGTKGGSSGSPVVDCKGRAVAINAGSKVAGASAYFLPLDRVVRALRVLQESKDGFGDGWQPVDIPRGTLQMTLLHKGFDETRRLGLRHDTEQTVRSASPPSETGMLVVDSVVPGGPSHKHLEPGDVLVRVNKEVVTQFLKLEILLDDNVDKDVELELERGGKDVQVTLKVQDLHSITPNYFLEMSGAIIHPLSYQQARNFRFNCGLVYVADPGYMLSRAGVPKFGIIKKLAGESISTLEDLIVGFGKLAPGARVPLEFYVYSDRHRGKSVLVTIERHEWYAPPQIYVRDDSTGLWNPRPAISSKPVSTFHSDEKQGPCKMSGALQDGSAIECRGGVAVSMSAEDGFQSDEGNQLSDGSLNQGETKRRRVNELLAVPEDNQPDILAEVVDSQTPEVTGGASGVEQVLEPTLVMMEVHIPPSSLLDGVHAQHFFGTGIIIHHSSDLGLIAVDRNTVAISVADIMLSFAAIPIEIPAEVVFLHPIHDFAVVAYNPSALGEAGAAAVRAAVLHPEPLKRGDAVHLVGLSRSMQATSRKSVVTNPAASLNVGAADCPRYRAMNMEVVEIDTDFGHTFSGVLADDEGRVQALWASFSTQVKYGDSSPEDHQFVRGIPISYISEIRDGIVDGHRGPPLHINGIERRMPLVRVLEVELYPTLLSKARSFGLSDKWVQALAKKDPIRRQVLRVKGCLAGSKAESALEQSDMLLAINNMPITCFQDVEQACQRAEEGETDELHMTVFRQGVEVEIVIGTDVRDGFGTMQMVNWAGCVVQDPHPAVRALGFLPEEGHGVYVARWCHGSPAHRYGLYALQWIVEVNGNKTPDLQTFIEVVKELNHGDFVRVKVVHLNGKPRVLTLKQDLHYWPTWELAFDPKSAIWKRRTIKGMPQETEGTIAA
ncbi:hypothetical protein SELMODRAFT_165477 [Selaginella moellendorffii]|uniref:PDZ domain-containing protein n=1 Tax=Selaginella moellendorffii TaxID=88036 RepID=D8QUT5_SELML|nr:protease Do-like 7 [Selaginella moellendorffii]EFJ36348.1 hypothetical protein SELMODRAFT_165477 [Selaginella moellendorffii]|eukprot:XP_002962885.1 protease Do-like 7 [Selaginella moellendorffii]